MNMDNPKDPELLLQQYFREAVQHEQNNSTPPQRFIEACTGDAPFEKEDTVPKEIAKEVSTRTWIRDWKMRSFVEGSLQVLLSLAASWLIVVYAGNASSGVLTQKLTNKEDLQKIGSAFLDLSKQLDEGLWSRITENN